MYTTRMVSLRSALGSCQALLCVVTADTVREAGRNECNTRPHSMAKPNPICMHLGHNCKQAKPWNGRIATTQITPNLRNKGT